MPKNHLKHKKLNQWYWENKDRKSSSYPVFIERVLRFWRDKDRAIIRTHEIKKPTQVKWVINEQWRECTICNQYKLRSYYHKSVAWIYWHTNDCRECRNDRKREYRVKTNYTKDKEYKEKKRKLNIGDKIKLKEPVKYLDTFIMPVWEVVKYEFKKWYTLYSPDYKIYKWLDTNDNKKINKNCVWFYKIT